MVSCVWRAGVSSRCVYDSTRRLKLRMSRLIIHDCWLDHDTVACIVAATRSRITTKSETISHTHSIGEAGISYWRLVRTSDGDIDVFYRHLLHSYDIFSLMYFNVLFRQF